MEVLSYFFSQCCLFSVLSCSVSLVIAYLCVLDVRIDRR